MPPFNPVTSSSQLRSEIQAATPGTTIQLNNSGTAFSVLTLAKLPCFTPAGFPTSDYAITGDGQTLRDTRIYQQNVDGAYGPSAVLGGPNAPLELNFTAGGAANGSALLRATSGSYTLDRLNFTGTHRGWDGNGNLYMSLAVSTNANPVNASLSFTNSTVNITGQGNGFNGTSGGSAFLHSWNNTGSVTLSGNNFDEAGYRSSFHFATMNGGAAVAPIGTYTISNNTFRRSSNKTTRPSSNRLESVNATLTGNTFSDGSALDIYGASGGVSLNSNTFNTIEGGYAIRLHQVSSSGATLSGTPTLSGTTAFNGPGFPLKYQSATSGYKLLTGGTITINGNPFVNLAAGGQAADTIILTGNNDNDWVSGDAGDDVLVTDAGNDFLIGGQGNDTLTSGAGADLLAYFDPTEGVDTITDFGVGDLLGFKSSAFGNLPAGFLNAANFSTTPTISSGVPTFIYSGGTLSYDADGITGGAVAIANLSGAPTLTNNSILIYG